jgi:hypothetical protein
MNAIAKVLVSASLSITGLVAQAAVPNIEYPGPFVAPIVRSEPVAATTTYSGASRFVITNNEAGLTLNPAYKEQAGRTVQEVRREARTRRAYMFVNA